jgi:dTDP-glucose pyrophosphorylase
MVGRVMDMLERGGVDRFVVVVHPDDSELITFVGGTHWADRVLLAYQDERRGMAHALMCASPLIAATGAEVFTLAACDNIYPEGHVAALVAEHMATGADATLTLMQVGPEQIPTLAVVVLEGGWVRAIVEKPRPEEAPSSLGVPALYVLSTPALAVLSDVPVSPRGELEFPDALRLLVEDGGRVGGVEVAARQTLTRPADLLALTRHFLRHDTSCAVIEVPEGAGAEWPTRIEAGVRLARGCRIGPEVYLEAGCRCDQGAILRRCVVLRDGVVEAGAVVEDVVLG